MNRVFLKLMAVIIIVCIMLYLVWAAWKNYHAQYITSIVLPFFIPDTKNPGTTTVAAIMLLSFVFGGLTGALYSWKVNMDCDEVVEYYKKKISKIVQNADTDSSLIESLQRKISSLEIALQNALKDKNDNNQ